MFYSKTTGGFYSTEIHGDNIPADAVEISAAEHQALINGQSEGKRITADENGFPVLSDPPAPTAAEIQAQINAEHRAYLASTDWYIVRFAETGVAIPDEIKIARQAARDSIV